MRGSLKKVKEGLLMLPSVAWLTVFFFIPTAIIFAFAFKEADIYGSLEEGWSLATVKELFNRNNMVVIIRTIWMSVLTTVVCLSLSIPIAYYLARANEKVRKTVLLLLIVPFWSSFLVRIFAWKILLHPEGVLKKILVFLGLTGAEDTLLYHPATVVLVMVYTYLPFAVIPLYAASSKFNFQLIEAAADLGATRWQAFRKVFLPGIQKGFWTACLMVFIPALGAYVIPDLVGGVHSEMIGNKIAQRTFVDRNLPLASALSALLALVVLVPVATIVFIQGSVRKFGKAKRNRE